MTAPSFELAQPTRFYRLEVERAPDGSLLAAGIENTELGVQPLPALAAEYLAIAYAGESVVSAVPVSFPRSALTLKRTSGVSEHEWVPVERSHSSVFVEADPSVDRIALVTPAGDVALEFAAATLPGPNTRKGRLPSRTFRRLEQAISSEQLAFRYAHIQFLQPGGEALLGKDALAGGRKVLSMPACKEHASRVSPVFASRKASRSRRV